MHAFTGFGLDFLVLSVHISTYSALESGRTFGCLPRTLIESIGRGGRLLCCSKSYIVISHVHVYANAFQCL